MLYLYILVYFHIKEMVLLCLSVFVTGGSQIKGIKS